MNQEDNFPPGGNGLGDACECEGDFDCDGDQDGTDAAVFKIHFGRSNFNRECTADDPCYGDFDNDGDADGSDAGNFKLDFGRSGFSKPCPACTSPVGVLFAVHGGTTTVDSNEYLWNAGMQQFSYDPNNSVYTSVIWNPNLWYFGLLAESSQKFIGKYDFEYPRLGSDPFEELTLQQLADMEAELDSNTYGINFEVDWITWMCGDCVEDYPYPRFIYLGPDGKADSDPDPGNYPDCKYCGEQETERVVLKFQNGTSEFTAGTTLTGQTSGGTAVIDGVTLNSGAWDGSAAGFLSLSNVSALTAPFEDGELILDDGTVPGSATADGTTTWPDCDPERFNVDGPVERLLKQGVHRIIMVDLTVGGVRFSKTYETQEMAQKMLDDWKEDYGVTVPLLWVNDYSDLMKRSYPIAPEGWTRSLGAPTTDKEVPLNGSPNPVSSDPDLATLQREAIEASMSGSVSAANTGVILMNHALHDWNEVFDPKMDDTVVLNENIKSQLTDITGIPDENIIGARMGIKVENPGETEHTLAERTREMRGENLGHQYLYETAKEFPSGGSDPFGVYHPWGYLYWDALDYLINTRGVDHIVIGFPQITTSSVLDMIEFPNQIGKEIGIKNWLYWNIWDLTKYPGDGAGHPFADYWGNWVWTDCGEWELPFNTGTEEIEAGGTNPVTLVGAAKLIEFIADQPSGVEGVIKEVIVESGSWAGGDAAGTIVLKDVVGNFTPGRTIKDNKGTVKGDALVTADAAQTISSECCFEMGGCPDDGFGLPRPYPPPRLTPLPDRAHDMDPSLAYDLSDFGHMGYDQGTGAPDPDFPVQDQYSGTWAMYEPPDDDPGVGALLAKQVINSIIKPMVYLTTKEEPEDEEIETIPEGESVTFTALVVTGGTSPYTYEWSTNKDDAGWVSQGTGSSWTLNTSGGDAGTYDVRCVVTDSWSESGELTWNDFVVSTP
jgi:hypothetical protein